MNQFPSTVLLRGKGVYGLLIIVLVASLLGHAVSVTAAPVAWYVDNKATGSNNGSSWANAWTSLSSVNFSSMNSGDTLYISGGSTSQTYSGTIKVPSGTTGITITKGVDAGHNGEVIFDGTRATQYGVSINGTGTAVKNVTVSNITFKAFTGAGVYGNGQTSGGLQNITVDNCKFLDFQRSGVFFEGNNNLNNNFGIVVKNSYFDDDNSYSSQSDGIFVQVLKDFTADHNYILLDNNYTGVADLHSDNIQAFWVDNIMYSRNTLVQRSSKTLGTQLLFTENGYGLHVFLDNIFIRDTPNAQDSAMRMKTGSGSTFTGKIIGNTYYGRGRIINSSVVTEIKDNILYGLSQPTTSGAFYSGASGSSYSNNLVYDPNNQFPSSSGSVEKDPMFVNASFTGTDLHLKSGSPAINAGVNLGASYSVDADGKTRDSAWDIGAYEFAGTVTPTQPAPTQPPAPTATRVPPTATQPAPTQPPAPTATRVPPTATQPAPTQPPAPTATRVPPTATGVAPTATRVPPTATRPAPTATTVPPNGTPISPKGVIKIYLPIIDSSVDQSQPQSNLGTQPNLAVDARPEVVSYMHFDVSGLNGLAVRKATLRIYTTRKNNHTVIANSVNGGGNWTETGLTFANAPALGDQVAKAQVLTNNAWINLDVTALVHGEGPVEIALTTNGNNADLFASRESGPNAPQLVVDLG